MTITASVISPYQKFYDTDGITPLSGGSVKVCANGTTTLISIFSDPELTVPQDNPYNLDAGGAINGDVHFAGFASLIAYDEPDGAGAEINTFDDVSCFDQSSPLGVWDATVTYSADRSASNIVQSPVDDNYYISIQNNNLNHEPSASPLWWTMWPFPSLTKGTLYAGNGTAVATLAVGTNGQAILADSSAPTGLRWADVAVVAATQAQMEAAASNVVTVTPMNAKWHPGVSKAWIKVNGAGTTISASHNITSVTDVGTGVVTVTLDTDFSSANYQISPGVLYGAASSCVVSSQLAGAFSLSHFDVSSGLPADPNDYFAACFGDQA